MPPPLNHPCLHLELLPQTFFVKQLPADAGIPPEIFNELNVQGGSDIHRLFSVTRTAEEISIVGESATEEGGDWRCIKIAGPMDFGLTGVVNSFTSPLKDAGVPVFAISTWNTDYVLVPKAQADRAVAALCADQWTFVISVEE
ncbi:hypothetical protein SERLADRAFT_455479 [Serpula lacrymans var. lacrymans S7.9]|uniref:CASTOR ACT domain-containing protein n=1 Tax=Serpula lacrymans var. lacrymans (strain S7.9) TaxID=578457 RepID=F8NG24_SERL9|nr:uncharacterized protein SERLADRAFT_455479 [Serpula lacrymans var. lacrymans S7.9]EGO30994.1 hypothetical protein SERLADRAFT_455479 [Serpula lacrymans var. lacrymans S7.9]